MEGTSQALRDEIASWIGRSDGKTTCLDISELDVSLGTTVGNVRTENQDRVVVAAIPGQRQASYLFALCDGLGGMRDGDVCSTLALSTIIASLLESGDKVPTGRLITAALAANAAVRAKYNETGGCTLSAVLFTSNYDRALFNVGDSRIYGYSVNEFTKMTKDDTISEHLKQFQKAPNAAANRRFSNQLTQFIGSSERLDSSSLKWLSQGHGGFVLSSDGLHSIDQATLAEIVMFAPSSSQMVRRLINISLWGKSKDNASMICIPKGISEKLAAFQAKDHLILWSPFGRADFFDARHKAGVSASSGPGQPELIALPTELADSSRKEAFKSKKKSRASKMKPKIHVLPGK